MTLPHEIVPAHNTCDRQLESSSHSSGSFRSPSKLNNRSSRTSNPQRLDLKHSRTIPVILGITTRNNHPSRSEPQPINWFSAGPKIYNDLLLGNDYVTHVTSTRYLQLRQCASFHSRISRGWLNGISLPPIKQALTSFWLGFSVLIRCRFVLRDISYLRTLQTYHRVYSKSRDAV